jgi:hypothetical protein
MPQAALDSPQRLPLLVPADNRYEAVNKDARMVNCFAERSPEGDYWINKRVGTLLYASYGGAGQGMYNWQGDLYAINGGTLRKNGAVVGSVDATNGVYTFSSTLGSTPKLVMGNGVKAYVYDGTTLTQITSSNFPSSFVKGIAYLDGTIYVMDQKAKIYGSNLNDPLTWGALNNLIAQVEPDGGVALAKQLVYVIALKQWTTEAFYDAANASGSPLAPVQGAKSSYGCVSADTVQSIDDILIWVSANRSGGPQVVRMEALTTKVISTKPIERLLAPAVATAFSSMEFRHDGHRFYVLTNTAANLTLSYDLDEGLWYQWTDSNGNYLPIVSATFDSALNHYWQHATNGKVYLADGAYYNDDGSLITVDIITPNYDAGSRRAKKVLSSLEVIGDQTPGSLMQVRRTDDDYTTWSTFRTIDLGSRRPRLVNEGSFYRRAYHFRHRSNTPMRVKAVELQLLMGEA